MKKINKYFELVKDQCIAECKQHSFEEVARNAFSKPEVVDLFLAMEKNDEAYAFVVNSIKNYFGKNKIGNIYVPGGGVGGLARRISDHFPKQNILQIDCSKKMIGVNKVLSRKYKNITVKKGDILKFALRPDSLDCIIAYGVMRYVPKQKRNALLDLWMRALVPGGIVIVGEGIGGEIVNNLRSKRASTTKSFSKKTKLFRCSLFYLLCKKYNIDKIFKKEVQRSISSRKNFTDALKDLAGFVLDRVYIKEFRK